MATNTGEPPEGIDVQRRQKDVLLQNQDFGKNEWKLVGQRIMIKKSDQGSDGFQELPG